MKVSKIVNFVGTHVVPFTNPRVICPPGKVQVQGRLNIAVVTPMRSGTHILLDQILNNLPAYRNRPLYIDLDQCIKQSTPGNDLLDAVSADAGYLLKTHMPVGAPARMIADPRIKTLIDNAVVLTVRRPRVDVCRSISRWNGLDIAEAEALYGAQYDAFWQVWQDCATIPLTFADLFDAEYMQQLMQRLGNETGTRPSGRYMAAPSGTNRHRIYINKMLTRLLGCRSPQINTTIHTLKC